MTNAGMMDCKKALTEAKGDLSAAVDILRKKGRATAAVKSVREAKEGSITQYIAPVEQGIYENGVFKFLRTQNGDATDFGLVFGEEPAVLRVSVASY